MFRRAVLLVFAAAWLAGNGEQGAGAQGRGAERIAPDSIGRLRVWDRTIDRLLARGELRLRSVREDALVPGRSHERADQFHRGVRVWGGDVARQLAGGQTVSIFGVVHAGIDIDTNAALTPHEARAAIERLAAVKLDISRVPELVVLPQADAGGPTRYRLTYTGRAFSNGRLRRYFVDARSGELVLELDETKTQTVGRGHGVLGDEKKVSTRSSAGTFQTWDELRPPDVISLDMRGDVGRTIAIINGAPFLPSDLASDTDNDWTDGAVVDAHVYAGWTYDYYFKRHGRSGLDNRNIRILSLVHPVRRQDIFDQPDDIVGLFYLNAAYFGDGIMMYGEGLPPGLVLTTGQYADFFSAALDIVAHELTHGVTDYSSQLIYMNESGALNEAFSDIMAIGAEFFFQTPGGGLREADYAVGEDALRPGGLRSASNPLTFGDPDHYSRRLIGPEDNGFVHSNSTIASHAFYLAIEGGTNRTSGLPVQGVGGGNREQIERVFYRAFAELLPASAGFSTARAATLQAARDLYGAGSAAERAVGQAWTAVGVN
jgi:bacillolysin